MRRKEIFWLIGTIAFVLITDILVFGIGELKAESVLDINIHDTYFVIANSHFILLFGVLIFFTVYLLRMLRRKFKNLTANLIFMISNILLSLIIVQIISVVNSVSEFPSTTGYPSLSGETVKQVGNGLGILTIILFIMQILLMILLAFCGFKTGLNYQRNG